MESRLRPNVPVQAGRAETGSAPANATSARRIGRAVQAAGGSGADQGRSGAGAARSETRLVSQAVGRAQAGDREAFAFLYARYADNIYGYVRSIVQNHHEAEDVTQQVFAKLFAVIGKYEQREVPFFAWILRVARNVAVDHIRGQRLVPVEEVRTSDEGGGDPAAGGRMRELTDALAELPHDQREVLVLRHFAGLSPPEIAERTGRTEGSIHGLHHRGRRALQADLQERGMAPVTFLVDKPSPRVAGA